MDATPDLFKSALRNFASGVTVVTSLDEDGQAVGATVSAFTSVSADPPMVLVCLNGLSRSARAIRESRLFNVHILECGQVELAQTFASDRPDKFDGLCFEPGATGAPLLTDCNVRLECELVTETAGGTHGIFVGLVRHIEAADIEPLLYANRNFCSVQTLDLVSNGQAATR
jgi:flavin reductase (DIM6/NTAB) family NADH-FMN oxidoreductase RutF